MVVSWFVAIEKSCCSGEAEKQVLFFSVLPFLEDFFFNILILLFKIQYDNTVSQKWIIEGLPLLKTQFTARIKKIYTPFIPTLTVSGPLETLERGRKVQNARCVTMGCRGGGAGRLFIHESVES